MNATLALVGRPNVGKSTLFNRLSHRRDALVADVPGLTRDRRYGRVLLDGCPCTLIDTGGLLGADGVLTDAMERQAEVAMDEADLVLFLVDARAGLTPADLEIADRLRRREYRVLLVVNKVDGVSSDAAQAEFAMLGMPDTVFVSAAHGRGIGILVETIVARLGLVPPEAESASEADAGYEAGADLEHEFAEPADSDEAEGEEASGEAEGPGGLAPEAIRVAIIGRPNVGKSTLTNRLLGEERQVVYDQPGTTRDAIEIPFQREARDYVLIDTAGVRRRGRIDEVVEKFSVVKTLEAIDRAHVVVLVMDAREGVVEQDLHLLGYAIEAGAGIIVAVNKWDGLSADARERVRSELSRRLTIAPWIPVLQISALHGTGVGLLLREVDRVYRSGRLDVGTTRLTRLLGDLVRGHPPPSVRGRQIKLRFAHKAGGHPPRIVIHGNQTEALPGSYIRYLENGFREALDLHGTPVHLVFKTGENPYAGRRNKLTPRQEQRRKRMIRHHKKNG
ncbi:MAG: ribosome biogenesis GTPase Der [Pseudomonadales bacterium]|nr:ribosome biogenesis GTPase Der [Pseudomonadales bacterium]